jgi:putative (di)nucleoside polyphosphate hydrolase
MADSSTLPYRRNVGIMLVNRDGLAFAARRLDTTDSWQMPQGGIDKGESPRAAGLRELKEEIGTDDAEIIAETRDWLRYDLPDHLVGKVWKGRYRGQEQKWLLARFTGRDDDIDLDTHHPEFDAWRWVRPEELPALIIPFKRRIYEAVVAEFLPLIRQG